MCGCALRHEPKEKKRSQPLLEEHIRQEMTSASEWLKSLGFRAPVLAKRQATNGMGGDYWVELREFPIDDDAASEPDAKGDYALTGEEKGRIRIDPDTFYKKTPNTGALVHELFHGVQASYKKFIFAQEALDWIAEGTADAAAIQWQIEAAPKLSTPDTFASYPTKKFGDDRVYDTSLFEGDTYSTSKFWRRVGTDYLISDGGIAYLDTIFSQSLVGTANDKWGLKGVHQGFTALGVPDGLYEVFPWFISTGYLGYTKDKIERPVIELGPGELTKTEEITGEIEPVAANATLATVKMGGHGRLSVEISVENPELEPDVFHLIVGDDLYNFATEKSERNFAEFIITEDTEFSIRVANISKEPYLSEERPYKLTISVFTQTVCGPKRMSGPEMVRAETTTGAKRIEGTMIASGFANGQGKICSDVMDGVPITWSTNIANSTLYGRKARFAVHTPPTEAINLRGIDFPSHGGNERWPANTAYEVVFDVEGLDFDDLREGSTYPARARLSYQNWSGGLVGTGEMSPQGREVHYLNGARAFAQAGWGQGLTGTVTIEEVYLTSAPMRGFDQEHRMIDISFDVSGEEAGADLTTSVIKRADGRLREDTNSATLSGIDKFPFRLRGRIAVPCLTPTCDKIPLTPMAVVDQDEDEPKDDPNNPDTNPETTSTGSPGSGAVSSGASSTGSSANSGATARPDCNCKCGVQNMTAAKPICVPVCTPIWGVLCPLE